MHASASIQELTTTTAQLQVTCTKLMQSSQISNIEVRNVGTGYQNQVSCDGLPVQIQYANLQQNTHYNVTMTASSITPSTCGITSFTTLLSKWDSN